MRRRASSMSARLGAVFVANAKHLLQYLPHGRERVELAALDFVQQASQLRVVGDGRLEMRLGTRRGDGENLAGQVAAPARVQLALRFQEGAMGSDLLPELLDVLAANRLGED